MNTKWLSILLILSVAVSLSGCSGLGGPLPTSGGGKSASVYYLESEIILPGIEMVDNAILDDEGHLIVSNNGQKPKLVFLDAKNKPVREIAGKSEGYNYVDGKALALDKDGNLYQLLQTDVYDRPNADKPREFVKRLLIYDPVGKTLKDLELARISGAASPITLHAKKILVDSKGRLYTLYMRGAIEVLDSSGKLIRTISGTQHDFMDLDQQDSLMVIERSGDDYLLEKINGNGKIIWKKNISENNGINTRVSGFKHCNGFNYVVDNSGVKKYDARGNFLGQILDFRDTSIIPSDCYITSFNINGRGELFITASNSSSSSKIYRYTPVKGSKAKRNQKTVVIGTADPEDSFLETAARKFEKEHPDIRIEIRNYSVGQSRSSGAELYQNYAKSLNTEILAGKGPDIISVQGLPYQKYVDKNVFLDLNGLIRKDSSFHRQDYYPNILKACENNGRLYALPVCFLFPSVIADEGMLEKEKLTINDNEWTWSEFYSYAKRLTKDTNHDGITDVYALPKVEPQELFADMLASNYGSFIDESKKHAHFDSPQFIRLLKSLKELSGPCSNSRLDQETLYFSGARGAIALLLDENYTGDLTVSKNILGGKIKLLASPRGDSGDNCFKAFMFGISRDSKVKKESWEFLKFMISAEQQKALQLPGLLVNQKAQNDVLPERAKPENAGSLCIASDKGQKVMVMEPLTQDQIKQVNQLIGRLNRCSNDNPQLEKMMNTEVTAFLRGEKSAEEAAKVLQNKATIYLNE